MTALPLIVGFGGIGPAGRSSLHHAYNRTIYESLPQCKQQETQTALSSMMGLAYRRSGNLVNKNGKKLSQEEEQNIERAILDGTLIRRLSGSQFDPNNVAGNIALRTAEIGNKINSISVLERDLPNPLPKGWEIISRQKDAALVRILPETSLVTESRRRLAVQAAGQLPEGFHPSSLYNSRFHPKGLQLAIIAASDAVLSLGIPWEGILQNVHADEIAVYAASAMAQLDGDGTGGMLQSRLRGKRPSAKQLPLGLNTMPADFVNAYVLGNVGATGANAGACATFLYNLRIAVEDIQSGRRRVAIVGNSEAPLIPEVIEGYAAMSALATDENLRKIDRVDEPDYRRASRPFGENCGFTLGESGQYFVLMEDRLAIELGADIHGSVPEVFVNADGFKKSISAPGPGNYITLAKAVASIRNILGESAVRNRSFVQAHGSSTPQNRVTESRVLDLVASAFGIEKWPVTAVKAFVGHSLAPASADQLVNALGVLRYGVLPGIKTIKELADDLFNERLDIVLQDTELGQDAEIAFLNSKGFGGNNATGAVIGPDRTLQLLKARHGRKAMTTWKTRVEKTTAASCTYDEKCLSDPMKPIYRFGESLIDENKIEVKDHIMTVPGFPLGVDLRVPNRYEDLS